MSVLTSNHAGSRRAFAPVTSRPVAELEERLPIRRRFHLARPRILVIEDHPLIREAITLLLEREGFVVECVDEGEEALKHLRASSRLPHVILLDLRMPVMSGWDFRAAQQQDPRLADIPVIVVSAAGNVRDEATALHASAWVQKPMDTQDLLRAIRRYC